MERLTKKLRDGNFTCECGWNYFEHGDGHLEIFNKLGRIEDLEEELGIPLEVLFKALKDGVWMKSLNYKDKTISYHKECVFNYKLREWILWIGEYENTFMREVKDYGKTWALTREELE